MLYFRRQKYGFYPIKLLFLQVRPQKLFSHQKGTENILADFGRHSIGTVCGHPRNTASPSADCCRTQGSGNLVEEARWRYLFREDPSQAVHDFSPEECSDNRQESGT